jgi:hypothetical protein
MQYTKLLFQPSPSYHRRGAKNLCVVVVVVIVVVVAIVVVVVVVCLFVIQSLVCWEISSLTWSVE